MKPFVVFVSVVLGLVFLNTESSAQNNNYPADYFRSPLGIPLYLSGTFGELRSNHFHSGIDIKTGGVEGKNVYAIADGYVSRIKVSTGGYGKAIYITHPNGYVSVYGHLQKYNADIQEFVKTYQYQKESFSVEIFPDKDQLIVKKGDAIAISGNTGGSAGPHLHFEIREEASQHPVNPLFFKSLKVKDYTRPKINEIAIYPVGEDALINGKRDTVFYAVAGWGAEHYLADKPEITVSGNVAFGINTHDLMNEIPNKNGVYEIEMLVDSTQFFGLKMDELSFSTTRYINSLIDYGYYKQRKRRLVRSELDTNNLLTIYKNVTANGIIDFRDSLKHNITFIARDVYKNTAILTFNIHSEPNAGTVKEIENRQDKGFYFDFSKSHKISEGNISISFPANAFYSSFYFKMHIDSTETIFSPIYKVHNRYAPVQKAFTIKIKPDSIDLGKKDKMYMAYSNGNGKGYYGFLSTKWEDGFITAKSRSFGKYTILIDSVSPEIIPANIGEGKNISTQQSIKVKIRDQKTGIKYFRGTLNNRWILMEYDPKKQMLTYYFDGRLNNGENVFKLYVKDKLGNEANYKAKLVY